MIEDPLIRWWLGTLAQAGLWALLVGVAAREWLLRRAEPSVVAAGTKHVRAALTAGSLVRQDREAT